ncbi:MAG: flavodoxin-dependent (E)-4-hydroxy-3-methylbut-2-enyl-diphosphate synthase [Verrucomicrobia bacterium]|nr:flavodoxin-dependent (E)-4-hydroxy-3-methylbut-2-enyl-diphosphate synthase [Verrucomicrobiota bacterium]
MSPYCASRFQTIRRHTHEVRVGSVGVGGTHPVRIQSMTTSDTQDIAATVQQSIALAEVGCEIVRITAPNVAAARCLRDIRAQLAAAGFGHVPIVADIHFLPSAAMEAVEHVEKIRVNPGNYADKKKFAVREYSDSDYDAELARLHEAFSPLVIRCKELGRSMRIGTNHGSLSDRIMNRYGDTPLGMVESALGAGLQTPPPDQIDPYHFNRRPTQTLALAPKIKIGPEHAPAVVTRVALSALANFKSQIPLPKSPDTPHEGLLVPVNTSADLSIVAASVSEWSAPGRFLVLELAPSLTPAELESTIPKFLPAVLLREFTAADSSALAAFATLARRHGHTLAIAVTAEDVSALAPTLVALGDAALLFTLTARLSSLNSSAHPLGRTRSLAAALHTLGSRAPLWIRNTSATAIKPDGSFLSRLLDASFLTGGLLCDGLGDLISIETETDPVRATTLAYNVLQGAGARSSKTEFVACPSCGRTLFDLQTTTQRIRAQTGHLKGVKLAIMGCIVNGPGEMADADFGYVGGAPGKINLYVGKTCVQYNLPQAEADARLIALIKEHGKWVDPAPAAV